MYLSRCKNLKKTKKSRFIYVSRNRKPVLEVGFIWRIFMKMKVIFYSTLLACVVQKLL